MDPRRMLERLADYDEMVAGAGGPENAGQQIDALRTGGGKGYLPGLKPEEYSQFDRYVHGINLGKQNPGVRGAVAQVASLPLAGGYEVAKYTPWLLNAAAKIPGLETLAVDETTSPPSAENLVAFGAGVGRNFWRGLLEPEPAKRQ